jgi:predicted small lipoprotein YifL
VLNSFAQTNYLTIGIAMRRAVGLILVFLALSACGNKAALYLPPPERDPQQDSKPAPRQ